jgi:hypothetical protein
VDHRKTNRNGNDRDSQRGAHHCVLYQHAAALLCCILRVYPR